MARKVIFVHGVGRQRAGYSNSWRAHLNPYLNLPSVNYIEVLWAPLLDQRRQQALAAGAGTRMRKQEAGADALANQIWREVKKNAVRERRPIPQAPPRRRAAGRARADLAAADLTALGVFDMISVIREAINDFSRYFLDKSLRDNVKAVVRDAILTQTQPSDDVSIVSHSWGSVVCYEMLHDLAREQPSRRVHALFTLGSPLWIDLIRGRLNVKSGKKPAGLKLWTNVDARGDFIGGSLDDDYAVDRDYKVPSRKGVDPHGSYFAAGNEAVLDDIVAHFIKR
ncbi:MAG: hypothetical protein WEE64_09210 [Dehalococcoidia bacterium]